MSDKRFTVASSGARIEEFLHQIIRLAGLDLRFQLGPPTGQFPELEAPEIFLQFQGPDVDELLANRAELLLALEQITMEMLRMAPNEHAQLCFDAHDYRLLRMEELRLSALAAAERVKKTRQPFQFNPMNSRERRILHLALRQESAVRSESNGIGPGRAVVVYPADMPSAPPAPARPAPRRR